MKQNLTQIYVTHNSKGKTLEELLLAMDRDNYLSPNDAVEMGIIDHVPQLTVPKPAISG